MSIGTILLIILILMVFGALPAWEWHDRGYGPSGGIGLVLLIVILVLIFRGGF